MNTNTPKDKFWLQDEIHRVFGPAGAHADIFRGMILNPCPQPSPSIPQEVEGEAIFIHPEYQKEWDEKKRASSKPEPGISKEDIEKAAIGFLKINASVPKSQMEGVLIAFKEFADFILSKIKGGEK